MIYVGGGGKKGKGGSSIIIIKGGGKGKKGGWGGKLKKFIWDISVKKISEKLYKEPIENEIEIQCI